MSEQKVLTLAEVAEILGIAEFTARKWFREGKLKGVNHGGRIGWRSTPQDIEESLREMRVVQDAKTALRRTATATR